MVTPPNFLAYLCSRFINFDLEAIGVPISQAAIEFDIYNIASHANFISLIDDREWGHVGYVIDLHWIMRKRACGKHGD